MPDDLLDNWKGRSATRQKAYAHFLKVADKNEVIPELPALHEEAFEAIDCMECANCCKNYSPRIKTPDLKRISKSLKMRESEFIARYLLVDEDGDFVVNAKPCPFLGANNACAIYEDRPSDCRRFPYSDEDVFIKRKAITLKNSSFCPITYFVLERLMQKIKI